VVETIDYVSVAGWFRAILPKSALIVEEEAWNAYPYTKTIYRCPFIEKFVLEIETVYHNDNGFQENVFNLSHTDLEARIVGVLCLFVQVLQWFICELLLALRGYGIRTKLLQSISQFI